MFELSFTVGLVLYIIVSVKVRQWITISALGFKSETPAMFIENPKFYDIVRSILFLISVAPLFMIKSFPWYLGGTIIAISWFGAGWIGRKKAFDKYRQVLQEMTEYSESEEERNELIAQSRKTDRDLNKILSKKIS